GGRRHLPRPAGRLAARPTGCCSGQRLPLPSDMPWRLRCLLRRRFLRRRTKGRRCTSVPRSV
ncbi:unnamed protein product, partial [Prorocentrum cordatum]